MQYPHHTTCRATERQKATVKSMTNGQDAPSTGINSHAHFCNKTHPLPERRTIACPKTHLHRSGRNPPKTWKKMQHVLKKHHKCPIGSHRRYLIKTQSGRIQAIHPQATPPFDRWPPPPHIYLHLAPHHPVVPPASLNGPFAYLRIQHGSSAPLPTCHRSLRGEV